MSADDYDLFSQPPLSHRDGPPTEKLAAAKIAPKAGTLRALVLELTRATGADGIIACEAADSLASRGIREQSVRPRFTDLRKLGLVEQTTRQRKNSRGNSEIVWIAR
jgi:hypothetical protein